MEAAPVGSGELVLVVVDDAALAQRLSACLSDAGYRPHVVAEAGQALSAAALKPRLMLVDLDLAGGKAIALMAGLRAQPGLAAAPILALSARVGAEDIATAIAKGADDFIAKPFDEAQLVHRLVRQLTRTVQLAPRPGGLAAQRGHVLPTGD